jgi:hypothetical protein
MSTRSVRTFLSIHISDSYESSNLSLRKPQKDMFVVDSYIPEDESWERNWNEFLDATSEGQVEAWKASEMQLAGIARQRALW